jgi:CheY-like chemotaxis protein/HPt (histidine-containing phosphotransfer) domain-containing protein
MPAGALDGLFQRFSQTNGDMAPRRVGDVTGAGLGLAISQKLAAALGGALAAYSTPGVGSRFVLAFRAGIADPLPVIASAPAAAAPPGAAKCLHLLIVDDQESNRYLAARLLRRFGITADGAGDATAAFECLRARRYDAVLLDLYMPGVDGIAAARAIRAMEGPTARIPLIAFSAAVGATDRRRCTEAGIAHFVEKPIRPAALHAAVRAATEEAAKEKDHRMDAIDSAASAPPVADDPELFVDAARLHETVALIGADEARALSVAALTEIGGLIAQARTALTSGDLGGAKAAAHAVAGIASNWAAMRLSEDARRLERGALDAASAEAMLDAMVRSWCGARAHMPTLIATAPDAQSAA